MSQPEKTKKIRRFKKKMDLLKFLCECPSDSEGFQILYYQGVANDTQPKQAPEIVEPPPPLINNANKESEDIKAPKKTEKKKSKDNPLKVDKPEIPKDSKEDMNQGNLKEQRPKIQQKPPNNCPTSNNQRFTPQKGNSNQNNQNQRPNQISTQDSLPKKFSEIYKDNSILLSADGKLAAVRPNQIEGKVLIDFPIQDKVSWQLKLNSQVEEASIGICQLLINPKTGEPTLISIETIDKNKARDGFYYSNNDTVRLTFDPLTRKLAFFKVRKQNRTQVQLNILPKKPGFQYYPYVFIKKGNVRLQMDWVIKHQKQLLRR